jgi:ribosomal protein S6
MKALEEVIAPFITPWRELTANVGLYILDQESELIGQHFEEKYQQLHIHTGVASPAHHVALGLCSLNRTSSEELANWAAQVATKLEPGGIMALGGHNPEHPEIHSNGIHPEAAAEALINAGFARVRVLRTSRSQTSPRYLTALYSMGRRYSIIAQKPATGLKFDVFSPVFSKRVPESPKERLYAAEATFIHRLEHENAQLKIEIEEIKKNMHAMQHTLSRATRRRGLRKLAYILKTKARTLFKSNNTKDQNCSSTELVSTAENTSEVKALKSDASNPIPLSSREISLHTHLFSK